MERITYRKSGVDINKANKLIEHIKPIVASTKRDGWLGNIGAFAGFFKPDLKGIKTPLFVASTDGVGTKLMIAKQANKHDSIGIDLVAMCVNDLVTCGAEPLFFLDYFASGKLKPKVMKDVLSGIALGCRMANTALIGGETAELPGMYENGVYDIAGFSIGIVDKSKVIDGSKIKAGDMILGVASSGPHSNGYSMIRKVFGSKGLKRKIKKEVLAPTVIYVKPMLDLIEKVEVKGMAHITGGGFFDNIVRMLPSDRAAVIFKRSWRVQDIFNKIQKKGNVKDDEMFRTFNMGIGMVLVVPKKYVWKARRILLEEHKMDNWLIGEIIKGKRRVELIES